MSVLSAKHMHDEAAAFEHVESLLWPDGPVCPHCGVIDDAVRLTGIRTKPSKKNPEGKERHGLWRCKACRGQFTVRKGTIFEESHVDLHLWLQAIHLMVSSKKGISSHQLARVLEVTQKTAWFLAHRIREAMRDDTSLDFGSGGGTVEVDETFIGTDPKWTKYHTGQIGIHQKMKVLTLVDRATGKARSVVIDTLTKKEILPILRENIAKDAHINTDEASYYRTLGKEFDKHSFVNHAAKEYGRGEITTNTVEGYFSVFKRGMKGIYQHCQRQHLHRYAAEFEFRYNHRIANGTDDLARARRALQSIAGRRLTYAGAST